ncbi:MAG: polar amino acid transport system substrate-binding protein [Oleispira sp.]|jgi:polar amino acid transport system substrate-binding protein
MNKTDASMITTKSLCCFIIAMVSTSFSHSEEITISTFKQNTAQIEVSASVMSEVYQRLGYDMKLAFYPGKRSIVEANKGTVDGELIRIEATSQLLTNLIRIPTPVDSLKVMAITRTGDAEITGMKELVGKKIGVLRGIELTDNIVQNLLHQTVDSIESLFKILLGGRVDVILFPDLDAEEYIQLNGLGDKIVINPTPMLEVFLYHFINKSKPTLIKDMSELLAKLKETGELDLITRKAEQSRR